MKIYLSAMVSVAALVAATVDSNAATIVYTSSRAYASVAGAQTLESFDSPTLQTSTEIVYPDVTFSCSGTSHCPGFFSTSSSYAVGGLSVYFASPDTATFTFATPITSFGILIAGLGDVGTTTLSISDSNGFSAPVFSNYTGSTTSFTDGVLFAGLTSDTAFKRVSFSSTRQNDGIFFDNLTYGTSLVSAVPLPASAPLFGAGLLALGAAGYGVKRKRVAKAA